VRVDIRGEYQYKKHFNYYLRKLLDKVKYLRYTVSIMKYRPLVISENVSNRLTLALHNAATFVAKSDHYNSEFAEINFSLGRRLEDMSRQISSWYLDCRNTGTGNFTKLGSEVYYAIGVSTPRGLGATVNKLTKLRAMMVKSGESTQYVDVILHCYNVYLPEVKNFLETKPTLIKGRVPSEIPRKTPERTLENTGTCSWCGQNVKREGSGLHLHGYTVNHGTFNGNCQGMHYPPIEISSDGLVALIEAIRSEITRTESAQTEIPITLMFGRIAIDSTNPRWESLLSAHNYRLESDLRHFTQMLKSTQNRLQNWAPTSLPG
jgi:hypothetical protein